MTITNRRRAMSLLTEGEATQFVVMALEGIEVATPEDFEVWVRGSVRLFFPHDMLIAGSVRNDFTDIAIDQLLVVDFPITYVDAVRLSRGTFTCPTLNSWFRHGYRPQIFDPAAGQGATVAWTPEFDKFDLKNVAAHGLIAPDRRTATYFSFSRIPGPLNERHAWLLELLVPHLHQAYVRATASVNAQARSGGLNDSESHAITLDIQRQERCRYCNDPSPLAARDQARRAPIDIKAGRRYPARGGGKGNVAGSHRNLA